MLVSVDIQGCNIGIIWSETSFGTDLIWSLQFRAANIEPPQRDLPVAPCASTEPKSDFYLDFQQLLRRVSHDLLAPPLGSTPPVSGGGEGHDLDTFQPLSRLPSSSGWQAGGATAAAPPPFKNISPRRPKRWPLCFCSLSPHYLCVVPVISIQFYFLHFFKLVLGKQHPPTQFQRPWDDLSGSGQEKETLSSGSCSECGMVQMR